MNDRLSHFPGKIAGYRPDESSQFNLRRLIVVITWW